MIKESGFVGSAAGGVEHRFVRARQLIEVGRYKLIRLVPGDGLVMSAAGPLDHGFGDATLLTEPVSVMTVEGGDAVVGEELRCRPFRGRFLGNGLGAVLAEFGRVTVLGVRIGPGATHAIETVGVIEFEKSFGSAFQTHVGDAALKRHPHTGDPGSGHLGFADADLFDFAHVAGAAAHRRANGGMD